jgi:signal transduction histidine kinase
VVQLDLPFIREELFPELAQRYFEVGEELDYGLAVFNQTDFPSEIIYRSDPLLSEDYFRSSDATAGFFGFIPLQELRRLWLETGLTIRGERRPGIPRMTPSSRGRAQDFRPPARREGRGQWRLMVRHRAGSLEAAVSHARNRNLAISLGILALLAASLAMIVLSTRRAQQLAKQQMEFVAGVTHELRTPLAVIRSAGQNLADGVIEGEAQVKEYGSLIEKEGSRLSGMVDQVLEFAGMQSQSKGYTLRMVRVGGIIETAIEDCRAAMEEKGLRLDIDVPRDLPPVKADPSALRQAIRNLLDNAIKYDDRGQSIGVRASTTSTTGTTEVAISVEDEGPGIPAADLDHVFEPFYRGRGAKTGQMRGSGLGLSLVQQIVEAHGGRVGVTSTVGQGSSFTIYLPAALPRSSMS